MDQEVFNMQLRKFLKNVGVTSQREIETATLKALENGVIKTDSALSAHVQLKVPEIGLEAEISGSIKLQ